MTINENNYEAYMLDYLEGNLDPLKTAELMAFLAENPGLEGLMPGYDSHFLSANPPHFTGKELLKKDFTDVPAIQENNFDEFCIACSENLLTTADRFRLEEYIKEHPDRQVDFDLYQQLRLTVDRRVVYTGKAALKKLAAGSRTVRYMLYALGMAASFAVVFFLASRNQPGESMPEAITVVYPAAMQKITVQDRKPAVHQVETVEQIKVAEREIFNLQPLTPIPNNGITSAEVPARLKVHYYPVAHREPDNQELMAEAVPGQSEKFRDSNLGLLLGKLNFWKAAETAVSGFNYLTEARLSLEKKTDESGKLTGLLINTESYTISGYKMK